jgi:hypothetical protein
MAIVNHHPTIDAIMNFETSNLTKPELGDLTFAELAPKLELLKKYLNEFSKIDPQIIPKETYNGIIAKSKAVNQQLIEVSKFSLRERSNPVIVREAILKNFDQQYDELLPKLLVIQNLKEITPSNFDKRNRSLEQLFTKYEELIGQKFKDFNKTIEETTTAVEEATKTRGVSVFAEIFESESKAYSSNATNWLIATIFLLIITVAASIWLLFIQKDGEFGFDHIQFMITKILIVSALFYGISLCIKNYKAQKHNELVNRHRFNALKTFQTFTTSTDDKRTKDVILLEATHTIFGHQTTGYNDNDSNESDLPTKVLDAIKSSDKA